MILKPTQLSTPCETNKSPMARGIDRNTQYPRNMKLRAIKIGNRWSKSIQIVIRSPSGIQPYVIGGWEEIS